MKHLSSSKKKIFIVSLIFLGFAFLASFIPSVPSTNHSISQEEQKKQIPEDDHIKSQEVTQYPSDLSVLHAESTPDEANSTMAKVVHIVDGDTIDVDLGGGNVKRVRYIGIDTPESVDPRRPVQCFGKEATEKNKELVENKTVRLEKDVSETDKYERLLRYVYVGDVFINKYLVEEGYAHASSYPPDISYQNIFQQAEQRAREMNKGLWSSCNATISTKTTPTASPSNSQEHVSQDVSIGGSCKYSCSSPDRDCSDFSSHAEAQTFFNCCGFTAQNDPMNLDNVGVGDGIACESLP